MIKQHGEIRLARLCSTPDESGLDVVGRLVMTEGDEPGKLGIYFDELPKDGSGKHCGMAPLISTPQTFDVVRTGDTLTFVSRDGEGESYVFELPREVLFYHWEGSERVSRVVAERAEGAVCSCCGKPLDGVAVRFEAEGTEPWMRRMHPACAKAACTIGGVVVDEVVAELEETAQV